MQGFKIILASLICAFIILNSSFAQTSASQIQQAQEALDKESALRQKLQQPQKFYIKKIIVQGASLLTEEKLKQIISPLERHWLNIQDIQLIIETVRQAYTEKNHPLGPAQISHEIKGRFLIIKVAE